MNTQNDFEINDEVLDELINENELKTKIAIGSKVKSIFFGEGTVVSELDEKNHFDVKFGEVKKTFVFPQSMSCLSF